MHSTYGFNLADLAKSSYMICSFENPYYHTHYAIIDTVESPAKSLFVSLVENCINLMILKMPVAVCQATILI